LREIAPAWFGVDHPLMSARLSIRLAIFDAVLLSVIVAEVASAAVKLAAGQG
jgi:hypothetical protein